jgi:putative PIN family toxin of toxin-antitoxin system
VGNGTKEGLRVILDTNVFVSALLFRGETAKLVRWWQEGKIVPVVTGETYDELVNVLKYPKFKLSAEEIKAVMNEEVLPYIDVIEVTHPVKGTSPDPEDDKFLSCAVSGKTTYLVTGDKELLSLGKYRGFRIIGVKEFIEKMEKK